MRQITDGAIHQHPEPWTYTCKDCGREYARLVGALDYRQHVRCATCGLKAVLADTSVPSPGDPADT